MDLRRSRSRHAGPCLARRSRPPASRSTRARFKPGDLFVALQGEARDGHEFVRAAFEARAAAALVARDPGDACRRARRSSPSATPSAGSKISPAPRARAANAKIVAVTGSAGKTTTKEMLRLACGALGRTHASAASYNNQWGVPLTLAAMPRDTEYGVIEIGMNHFGEIRCAGVLRPPACGADHDHRAGASGILRQLRGHRRCQIGNLRRARAGRRRADPGRQPLCRASRSRARQAGPCQPHPHLRQRPKSPMRG